MSLFGSGLLDRLLLLHAPKRGRLCELRQCLFVICVYCLRLKILQFIIQTDPYWRTKYVLFGSCDVTDLFNKTLVYKALESINEIWTSALQRVPLPDPTEFGWSGCLNYSISGSSRVFKMTCLSGWRCYSIHVRVYVLFSTRTHKMYLLIKWTY